MFAEAETIAPSKAFVRPNLRAKDRGLHPVLDPAQPTSAATIALPIHDAS